MVAGTHPTNDISIKFKILPKFAMLWFKMSSNNQNEISHTSRQCNCRDMCKILLWSVEYILNYGTPNFDRISISIEIPLVGRDPRPWLDGHKIILYPQWCFYNGKMVSLYWITPLMIISNFNGYIIDYFDRSNPHCKIEKTKHHYIYICPCIRYTFTYTYPCQYYYGLWGKYVGTIYASIL